MDFEKKIKVVQAIDTFTPVIDGAINVVKNYANELAETETCVVCAPKPAKKSKYKDNEKYKVIRCNSLPAPEKYRLALPFIGGKFKKALKEENPDIIHVHTPFTLGRFCVKYAKKHKIPCVITLHTKYKLDFIRTLHGFKPLVNFMMRFIMRTINRADSVWTVSDTATQTLREYGYKGKIEVIKSGTDFTYPENAAELTEKINSLHNLKGQKNVFLFVGRIAMYKNLDMLLNALKIVKEAGADFKMLMVGGGFDLKTFREKVSAAGLLGDFIFTDTVKDRTLLQGYYLRSDLFLFPSTFDTCSLVSIEAAAHKLPVLVIKGSCPAENVVDGVNGFTSLENAEDYADKILDIIKNPERMVKAGEEAQKTIYKTWGQVAKELRVKYREIIAEYAENSAKSKNK